MAQSSSRRSILIGLGALAMAVGVVGAVALWTIGGERRSDAVAGFARAPVGCDTTLDFVETGEYFVFIERAGRLDGIRGDCDVEGAYDVGAVTPDADIAIVDPEGQPIALDRTVTDLEYSQGGFVGAAAFTIDITETDDHVVRVESPADEVFVVAVGRDPNEGVAALRGGAAAVGILGLLLGAGLILLGARRARVEVAAPQWAPGAAAQPSPFVPGQAPQGPPVYGQPAGPPSFGQPPQYGQQAPPQYGQARHRLSTASRHRLSTASRHRLSTASRHRLSTARRLLRPLLRRHQPNHRCQANQAGRRLLGRQRPRPRHRLRRSILPEALSPSTGHLRRRSTRRYRPIPRRRTTTCWHGSETNATPMPVAPRSVRRRHRRADAAVERIR